MNLSSINKIVKKLFRGSNRPLVNILTLEHVMEYELGTKKEYSLLLKSCLFFYFRCIDDREQHDQLRAYSETQLPWNINAEREKSWFR